MTGPMINVPAAQGALQTLPDQGVAQPNKQGDSKFDAVLADKAQATSGAAQPQSAQSVRAVETVASTEKPTTNLVSHVVRELEAGHLRLEKLIETSASGKTFSNAELLSLQASMYKYTLELDLTSKVVEKATTGIKDVVKTQV
ncbi:ATP-dependent helicase HrpB [Hyalangium rubrum]|uniref:ATP-dependent helicase HrpB n=1 Tax=Hyalangium rubrum TaxID=3103134 RepID=A0ABU5HD66_9BACT|nr:ATP-dependent helicase HrpB [Hyalangium sp. s54d21]MDY7231409.1 ATP-dependent helicase HrpB [Hyalangium sp. s54d21]